MTTIDDRVAELIREAKTAREAIERGDDVRSVAIKKLQATLDAHSDAINSISKKLGRPTGGAPGFDPDIDRKAARGLIDIKRLLHITKIDVRNPLPEPSEQEIIEASDAIVGIRNLLHCSEVSLLRDNERKALTSFALGNSGFILPPEMSNQVLSCLIDDTDLAALMNNVTISGPSIRYMVDNADWEIAQWACDSDCWSPNSVKNLMEGMGELEIKPGSLRFVVCVSRDLLEDSSTDLEQWIFGKTNRAYRAAISASILTGDGRDKPEGLLTNGTIPVCDTSDLSAAGTFTWQDLIALKWQVPMQYHPGSYLMNQNTFGLVLTMSDANGRPVMIENPTRAGQFLINGSPVTIATQMRDALPGNVAVAFGNWSATYTVTSRKAVTMQQDPYSAGFCILYKFEARVGGAVTCPNAARFLRIQ